MARELKFQWMGPYRIIKEFNESYQLGTLAREVCEKWVNGFRLKPYMGSMAVNPFKDRKKNNNNEETTGRSPRVTGKVTKETWPEGGPVQPIGSAKATTFGVGG